MNLKRSMICQNTPEQFPERRNQKKKSQRICYKTGRYKSCRCDNKTKAVKKFVYRQFPAVHGDNCLIKSSQTLIPENSSAYNSSQKTKGQGIKKAQFIANRYEDGYFD